MHLLAVFRVFLNIVFLTSSRLNYTHFIVLLVEPLIKQYNMQAWLVKRIAWAKVIEP